MLIFLIPAVCYDEFKARVADALEIGQRTLNIAKQSICIGLGASFVFMIIASLGFIPPTVGALLQEVFDVARHFERTTCEIQIMVYYA